MRISAVLFLAVILATGVFGEEPASGAICVVPNSEQRPDRFSPGQEYNPKTLMLRIDKRVPTSWPHKEPLRIGDLDLTAPHLVVLTSEGKPIQAMRFKFSEYKVDHLCMSFDGYQGIQLQPNLIRCHCK